MNGMNVDQLDDPTAYVAEPVGHHGRYDPDERRAARWLLPLAAVTAALVVVMIWYFASRQY